MGNAGRAGAFLKVAPEVLAARIAAQAFTPDDPERDVQVRAWRTAQIARCTAAVDLLPGDTMILDGELPTSDLATQVLHRIQAAPRG